MIFKAGKSAVDTNKFVIHQIPRSLNGRDEWYGLRKKNIIKDSRLLCHIHWLDGHSQGTYKINSALKCEIDLLRHRQMMCSTQKQNWQLQQWNEMNRTGRSIWIFDRPHQQSSDRFYFHCITFSLFIIIWTEMHEFFVEFWWYHKQMNVKQLWMVLREVIF
jgi:hypothetical protein